MNLKKLGNAVADAGKAAKDLAVKSKEQAIRIIDQNNDGSLDMLDIDAVVSSAGEALQRTKDAVVNSMEEHSRISELKALRPIFPLTLEDASFALPKLVRVTERDKKHADSIVCQGSVGYLSDQKGFPLVNIYLDSADAFGLSFYPECDCGLFYADPTDRDCYIALEEYFVFLRTARIGELQKIAQSLGAKHFKVSYVEDSKVLTQKAAKAHAKAIASGDADIKVDQQDSFKISTAAEMVFPGHKPNRPELRYLQKEPSVLDLIDMRMDIESPILHQKLTIKLSNSSGIRESEAMKIDAVLQGIKYSGSFNATSESKRETHRYLEYEIDF